MSMVQPGYHPQQIIVYTQTAWSRFWSWIGWLGFIIMGLVCMGLLVAVSDYFDTTGGIEEKFRQPLHRLHLRRAEGPHALQAGGELIDIFVVTRDSVRRELI